MGKDRYHLVLIDNAGIYHSQYARYGDFSFVCKGINTTVPSLERDTFPFDRVRTIVPSAGEANRLFGSYIDEKQIKKICKRKRPLTYVIWNHALWIQIHKHSRTVTPNYTKEYYAPTLEALASLTKEQLYQIWSEGLRVDRKRCELLIEQTLQRRDQLLKAAYTSGTIL